MTDEERALEVIGEIYDAALEPERWPQVVTTVSSFIGGPRPLLPPPPHGKHDWSALANAATHLDARQRERMQMLLPHLMRASEVADRLGDAGARRTGALAGLDSIGCGVVILDERASPAFVNQAARRIFAEDDGLKIRGRLFAADPHAQKTLEAAIVDCLRPGTDENDCSRGLRVPRPSKRPDYVVQVTPLARHTDLRAAGTPGTAMVFISDPDSQLEVDAALLRLLYGLTRAESRLAQLLLNGETLAGAAKELKVSESTAKTQLQHIFQKTETHRQADLVRLLLSLASTNR